VNHSPFQTTDENDSTMTTSISRTSICVSGEEINDIQQFSELQDLHSQRQVVTCKVINLKAITATALCIGGGWVFQKSNKVRVKTLWENPLLITSTFYKQFSYKSALSLLTI
jgi:hypothetical protein